MNRAKTYNLQTGYDSFVSFPIDGIYTLKHSLHAAIHKHIAEFKASNPDADVAGWATWVDDDGQQNLRLYLRARQAAPPATEDGGTRAQTRWEEGLC